MLLGGALFIFAPEVSLHAYAREVRACALAFYEWVGNGFAQCGNFIGRLAGGRSGT
jgi:hypothetical protein